MQFELKSYKGNNYVEYSDKTQNLLFNNASYFIFDVTSETFEEIMSHTGGWTAEMTTRHIKQKELKTIKYIMLCIIPQKYVNILFEFLYLDENRNILDYMTDDNYFDYEYFKKKFTDCITEEGFIFDLVGIKSLSHLTEQIYSNPTTNFGIEVENKDISFNEKYFCTDFSFLKENIIKHLNILNAKAVIFKLEYNHLNCFTFRGKVINKNNEYLLDYQVTSGIKDKNKYIEKTQDKNVNLNEFTFTFPLSYFKKYAHKMTCKI